jgi:AcrR family transcriptional regulator
VLAPRQAELADAALRILSRDGIAAVSYRAVATESGWSLGAVQKAFASRTEMDAAMLERMRTTAVVTPPGGDGRRSGRGSWN